MRRAHLAEIWGKISRKPHGCSLCTWPGLHHLRSTGRQAPPALLRWACSLVLLLLLLTACAGPAPVVQEVKVPVYRACVAGMPDRPTFAVRGLAPDASDGEKVLALARDLPLHLKYEAQLEAVIAGCM